MLGGTEQQNTSMYYNRIFYIPLLYTLVTRLGSIKSIIAWGMTYVIPFLIVQALIKRHDLLLELLLIFGVYTIYECGYIYNDAVLTLKEKFPTFRLNTAQMAYYQIHSLRIYLVRFFWSATLIFIIGYLDREAAESLLLCSILIIAIFTTYNRIRSRWSIPLYSILVWLRYFGPGLLLLSMRESIFLFLTYPLCVMLEFAGKQRFGFTYFPSIQQHDHFRVFYYGALAVLMTLCQKYVHQSLLLVLVWYFFAYRLLSLFISKWFRK